MSPAPKVAPAPNSARSVSSLDSIGDVNPMMKRPESVKRPSTLPRGIGLQCEKCLKNVGIKEERKACGKLWHVDCFRCGGIEDDGCKRTLSLDAYTSHDEQPYCRPCYGKLFGPKVFLAGSATLNSFLETDVTLKNDRFAKVTDTDEFLRKQRMSQMSRLSNMSGGSGGASSRDLSEHARSDPKAQVITALSNLKLDKRIGPDTNCFVCSKGVGLKEQRRACKKTWHVDCFTCGGTNTDGCKKKLTLDSYTARDDMPYCRPCYGKLYGPKGFLAGSATMNSFIETDSVDLKNDRFHKVTDTDEYLRSANLKSALMDTLASMKDRPLRSPSSSPISAACFKCSKNVGLKEQRLACKKNWHVDCFTCGGTNTDGCHKTLTLDGYTAKDDMPYCRPCYHKLFGPKGFMAGSATMNSFIENAGETIKNDRFYKVTDHDKYLKGGSALSAMLTPSYSIGSMSSGEGTRGVNGEFLDQLSGIVGSPHFKPNGKQEAWV